MFTRRGSFDVTSDGFVAGGCWLYKPKLFVFDHFFSAVSGRQFFFAWKTNYKKLGRAQDFLAGLFHWNDKSYTNVKGPELTINMSFYADADEKDEPFYGVSV